MFGGNDMKQQHTCRIEESLKERLLSELPELDIFHQMAQLYKTFGDATRLRIMYLLLQKEMIVCDIAACLNMTHSAISHQLAVLKSLNLVKYRKEGKQVKYSLADYHVSILIATAYEHISE